MPGRIRILNEVGWRYGAGVVSVADLDVVNI
jgi:hypothetical protein